MPLFHYEHRGQRPVPVGHFARRVLAHVLVVIALGAVSLFVGMAGYVAFEGLPWLDAFLNASMILGGMGPIHSLATPAGKLFAGLYALYSGLVFIAAVGLLAAPMLHRVFHTLHWEETQ